MIVYWAMFAYVGVVGYMSKFFIENKHLYQKYNNGTTIFFAVLTIAVPVFLIGMRTEFNDTYTYIQGFKRMSTSLTSLRSNVDMKGYGFYVYRWIIKRFITENENTYLLITAIIQASALLKFYYKYSTSYVYSMLLFFLSMSFTNMMGGIRQFLSVSLILFFSDYIFEKKTLKFFLVLFVAYSIHATAIIWLPVYFIVQGKPWNFKIIASMLCVVIIVLLLNNFTDLLSDALEGTDYEGYTNQFAKDDGSSIFHTLIASVPVIVAFWKRKEIEAKNNKYMSIMVNSATIAVMVSLLANMTSGILIGRFPIYFTVFNYALLPLMFENVFENRDKALFKLLCLIGYALYAFYYINISMHLSYISSVLGIRK